MLTSIWRFSPPVYVFSAEIYRMEMFRKEKWLFHICNHFQRKELVFTVTSSFYTNKKRNSISAVTALRKCKLDNMTSSSTFPVKSIFCTYDSHWFSVTIWRSEPSKHMTSTANCKTTWRQLGWHSSKQTGIAMSQTFTTKYLKWKSLSLSMISRSHIIHQRDTSHLGLHSICTLIVTEIQRR